MTSSTKPLYSIFDSVAGFYCPVFLAENDSHAVRIMRHSIDFAYKQDYTLFRLGKFNTDEGTITDTTPELVVSGLSLTKENDQ